MQRERGLKEDLVRSLGRKIDVYFVAKIVYPRRDINDFYDELGRKLSINYGNILDQPRMKFRKSRLSSPSLPLSLFQSTMPRSPPPDRYTPHYSSRDAPRRNYRDEYDRRGPRDEYRRPPLASSYRGRRDYGSPPRGRDRSWDRGERDYPRERERYDDRERERYDDRKRTRSPSPPPPPRRRFSPPPPPRERDDRFRRYTSYDRPPSPVSGRGSGLTYAPAETPRNEEERDDAEEVSEEEGMVTPPGVKRKLEDVKRKPGVLLEVLVVDYSAKRC